MPTNRVLCVEDDADIRELLKFKLGLSDFEVALAPDLNTASVLWSASGSAST